MNITSHNQHVADNKYTNRIIIIILGMRVWERFSIHAVVGQLQLMVVVRTLRCADWADDQLEHTARLVAGRIVSGVHNPMAAHAEEAARRLRRSEVK